MLRLSLCFASCLLLQASAGAAVFVGSGFTLVDAGTAVGEASGDIVISGNGGTVGSFDSLTISGFTHTWIGDLVIVLTHVESTATVTISSPPDLTSANFNGDYTFSVNAALQTIDEAVIGLGTADDLASGDYAISTYGGGTDPGPRNNFDALGGIALDGTWRLTVLDFASGDTGAVQGWSMNITAVPEPGSLALLSGCTLGLIGMRRRRRHS